jgi:hypothetical protein
MGTAYFLPEMIQSLSNQTAVADWLCGINLQLQGDVENKPIL